MNLYTTDYPRTRATRKPAFVPTNKILVAIPFWEGDRKQASKLIRLLTDLEDKHNEWADVVLVARFDCKHDPRDVELISRRFNVHTLESRRRETGWPAGCNGLAFGTIEWFAGSIASGAIPNYKALLINEADTVPLIKNWAESVNRAWDVVAKTGAVIAGAMVGGAEFGKKHVNGGCILLSSQPDFMKWMLGTASRYGAIAGWDWALAEQFERLGWADIPSMKSYWKRGSMGQAEFDQLVADGCVLLHGIKDDSLIRLSRARNVG